MAMDKSERKHTYQVEKVRLRARKDFERTQSGCGCLVMLLLACAGGVAIWIVNQGGLSWPAGGGAANQVMADIDAIAVTTTQPSTGGPAPAAQADAIVRAQTDPRVVADLVRQCDARAGDRTVTRTVGDFYWDVRMAAIARLGQLKGDTAAKAVVGLLLDAELFWNDPTERALMAAATRIGKPCLPLLAKAPKDHPRKGIVKLLIATIQRGETIRP